MANTRTFSQNALGDNAQVYLGDSHVTVNTNAPDADKLFLQDISQTDPIYDKKDILMRKGPLLRDSYRWILDHEDFKNWYCAEKTGVLWIKGDPGKGKTMLLCGIIEELEVLEEFEKLEGNKSLLEPQAGDFHGANVVFFFCQAADYRANTAAAVIRELIYSLIKQDPFALEVVLERYGAGFKGHLSGDKALAMLCDLFEIIVRCRFPPNPNTICVVDALDECIEDSDHLLNLIIKTSDVVKWLVSSRKEKNIEKKLAKASQTLELELGRNAQHVSASVDIFINHHVQEIAAIQGDETLQSTTSEVLKIKASGTFLWAALVIEQLHSIDHWEVEDALEEMPKGLGSIYDLALDRIDKLRDKPREACRVLLSIAVAAKRPLRLKELLIFINGHWKGDGRFKSTYQLRDVRDMTNSCGSILSIRDETVYFVHQSAKDYILHVAAERIFPVQHQHYKMFETSLQAMSGVLTYDMYNVKDPKTHIDKIFPKDVGSDPLASLKYCCVFWVEHLAKGLEHFEDTCQGLYSFLMGKFLCWIEALALMRGYILHALHALQKLKKVVDRHCEGIAKLRAQSMRPQAKYLKRFLADACRFVTHSTTWVPHWPLQLYFLAIESEPGDSVIKTTFGQIVRDRFGPMPAVFNNISQRQQSSEALPRTITFPRLDDDSIGEHYLTFARNWYSRRLGNKRPIITSWVINKGREDGDVDDIEDHLSQHSAYMEATGSMKNNTGAADMDDGLELLVLVPRQDVLQDRRISSAFPCVALDLSQGPYQGLDTCSNSAFVQCRDSDCENEHRHYRSRGISPRRRIPIPKTRGLRIATCQQICGSGEQHRCVTRQKL